MKKIISILLIIIGLILILIPICGSFDTQRQQEELLKQLSQQDQFVEESEKKDILAYFEELENNLSKEATEQTKDLPISTFPEKKVLQTAPPKKEKPKYNVMGIIQIDKINIKVPIVEGIEEEKLSIAVGHIPGTALPGQPGNCVIAGHRSYTFGKYFNQLDKIVKGDEIKLVFNKNTFKYKVTETKVVEPKDISVLKGNSGKKMLSLITCTPIYVASHRLVVSAEMVE